MLLAIGKSTGAEIKDVNGESNFRRAYYHYIITYCHFELTHFYRFIFMDVVYKLVDHKLLVEHVFQNCLQVELWDSC